MKEVRISQVDALFILNVTVEPLRQGKNSVLIHVRGSACDRSEKEGRVLDERLFDF